MLLILTLDEQTCFMFVFAFGVLRFTLVQALVFILEVVQVEETPGHTDVMTMRGQFTVHLLPPDLRDGTERAHTNSHINSKRKLCMRAYNLGLVFAICNKNA